MAMNALFAVPPLYVVFAIVFAFTSFLVLRSRSARLGHIPGPFLAKYSDAWRAYQAWTHFETGSTYQSELCQEYGDVVRIGPKAVLVNDPHAIPTILGIKARLDKGPGYIAFQQPGAPPSLVSIFDERSHGELRRPINHAYTLSALKGYEPYIDDTIRQLVGELDNRSKSGERIDIGAWLHYWSYDVIGKLSFGEPIGFMDYGSDFTGMISAQRAMSRYVGTISNWPFLHSIFHGKSLLNIFRDKPSVFSLFVRRIVGERLALARANSDPEKEQTQQFPDFLSKFIAAQKSHPHVVTDSRIAVYATSNVIAGSLATSRALAESMTFLSENPNAQDKLFRDIIATEKEDRDGAPATNEASPDQHEEEGPKALNLALRIPYLEALILEAYRCHRSFSTNLERVVSAAGLTLPSGQHLPPGTLVGLNVGTLGHRKDVYGPDADVFNPLRWMRRDGEDEEAFTKRKAWMNSTMITFGHGSRSCMGKNLVQLEMFKVLATILGRFKFHAVGEPGTREVWVHVERR